MKVKKGDKVKVMTGKYKGTIGDIVAVFTKKNKVAVEGVNVKKRAIKNRESSTKENYVYLQHPIDVSNVKLVVDEVEASVEKPSKAKKATKTVKKSTSGKKTKSETK